MTVHLTVLNKEITQNNLTNQHALEPNRHRTSGLMDRALEGLVLSSKLLCDFKKAAYTSELKKKSIMGEEIYPYRY